MPSADTVMGLVCVACEKPDRVSVTVNGMLTFELFQPAAFGAGENPPKVANGGFVSFLTVIVSVEVPPSEVAVQVSCTPAVSSVTVVEEHPFDDVTADSSSMTDHCTCTLLRYQVLFPRVPMSPGTITG